MDNTFVTFQGKPHYNYLDVFTTTRIGSYRVLRRLDRKARHHARVITFSFVGRFFHRPTTSSIKCRQKFPLKKIPFKTLVYLSFFLPVVQWSKWPSSDERLRVQSHLPFCNIIFLISSTILWQSSSKIIRLVKKLSMGTQV